ncbi:MAG: MFS transporter [Burkholderiales bacterium]
MRITGAPDPAGTGFVFVLVSMLGGQALGTMATMTLPAIAPAASSSLGVPSSLIGYQISILAAAMLFSLLFGGNLSTRGGACRVTQIGLALLTLGCLIATGPHVAFFFTSAICLGLGYGLLTPSASHLLMRYTPAHRRNVLFSLKQTGVPIGGIAASIVAPALATAFGWRWALVADAVLLSALIVLLQRRRAQWDDDRTPDSPLVMNPLEGIVTIWRYRALRYLSIAGACLVVPQVGLTTFTVVLFAEEMGYTLVTAGLVLTASQVAGVGGRVFWGWVADLTGNCYTALSVLSAVMIAAALFCLTITPAWPLPLACALFFVFGSTASGWNGAFLAEIARTAPPHAVSRATGGSLFYVNVGKMLGPVAVTVAYAFSGSYSTAFALLGIAAAAALVFLLAARSVPAVATVAAQRV